MNASGVPDFNALQNSIDNAKTADVVYFVFDLPFHGGKDLRQVPLVARRAKLQELLSATAVGDGAVQPVLRGRALADAGRGVPNGHGGRHRQAG